MNAVQEYQLQELSEQEMMRTSGGWTGSDELGHDIGVVLGAAVGFFMRIGESFYRSGGVTGTNPFLR